EQRHNPDYVRPGHRCAAGEFVGAVGVSREYVITWGYHIGFGAAAAVGRHRAATAERGDCPRLISCPDGEYIVIQADWIVDCAARSAVISGRGDHEYPGRAQGACRRQEGCRIAPLDFRAPP